MPAERATNESFKNKVQESPIPILAYFYASWTSTGVSSHDFFDNLADQKNNEISVIKIDVDACDEVIKHYGVRGVPTFMVFREGKVIATKVGTVPEDQITAWLESII